MQKLQNDILSLLHEDSRYSAEKIATMLGITTQTAIDAINDLENRGVIVKYTTVINEEKTGNDYVEALIEVKVMPQQSSGFDDIAEEIYKFDEVKSVYLMSGAYDLCVFIEGKTLREVAMFVSERLSTLNYVTSTATHFILKKYKVDGNLIEEKENIKRIAVQP